MLIQNRSCILTFNSNKMLGSIEDPQVKIRIPKSQVQFLKDKLGALSEEVPEKLKKLVFNGTDEVTLTVDDVKWLKVHGNLETPLHELLTKWDLQLPEPSIIPRNPELEARIQRLKLEQLERDYQAMTKNVDNFRSKIPDDSIGSQSKQISVIKYHSYKIIFPNTVNSTFGKKISCQINIKSIYLVYIKYKIDTC